MFEIVYYHAVKSSDGLANERIIESLFGSAFVISGLNINQISDTVLTISPGSGMLLYPVTLFVLKDTITLDVSAYIQKDGEYSVIVYNPIKTKKQLDITVLSLDSIPSWNYDDYLVLTNLTYENGAITRLSDISSQSRFTRHTLSGNKLYILPTPPDQSYDKEHGFRVGDIIVSKQQIFFCVSNTVNNAQWISFSSTGSNTQIGIPSDGTYSDGLLGFQPETTISNAIDDINEVLKYIAPSNARPLEGELKFDDVQFAYVSDGITVNNIQKGDFVKTTNKDTLVGHSPDPDIRFNYADRGILQLRVNGTVIDAINLQQFFDESKRDDCQTTPWTSSNGNITVTKVCKFNSFPLWQIGNCDIILNMDPLKDKLIVLEHVLDGSTQQTIPTIVFYDSEQHRPQFSITPTVSIVDKKVKYLSGVQYYTIDSVFRVQCTIDYLFEYCYVSYPITIQFANSSVDLSVSDPSLQGVSSIPKYDDQVSLDYEWTLTQDNVSDLSALVTVIAKDQWGQVSSTETTNLKRLINTYSQVSTDNVEYFQDEVYRLPDDYNFDQYTNGYKNLWNSQQLLVDGQAQVMSGYLVKAHIDYSNYLPIQNVDYSNFVLDGVYYRTFVSSSPHSNGTIRIGNISVSDIGSTIKLYIKLPTQTGWLSLQDNFNVAEFTGADNDGARTSINQDGDDVVIGWSSGTFSTANSGYRIYMKVVMTDTTKSITKIVFENW